MLSLDQAKCPYRLLFISLIAPFISQGPSVDRDKRNILEQRGEAAAVGTFAP